MFSPFSERSIVEIPVFPNFLLHWFSADPLDTFLWGVNLLVDTSVALIDYFLPGDYFMAD